MRYLVEKDHPYFNLPIQNLIEWLERKQGLDAGNQFDVIRLPEGVLFKQENK